MGQESFGFSPRASHPAVTSKSRSTGNWSHTHNAPIRDIGLRMRLGMRIDFTARTVPGLGAPCRFPPGAPGPGPCVLSASTRRPASPICGDTGRDDSSPNRGLDGGQPDRAGARVDERRRRTGWPARRRCSRPGQCGPARPTESTLRRGCRLLTMAQSIESRVRKSRRRQSSREVLAARRLADSKLRRPAPRRRAYRLER